MVCPFARFVVHYKNGETVVEKREDPHCWDDLPKENIAALGVLYDPLPLFNNGKPVLDEEGNQLRITFPESVLKGSSKYQYGFFQFKTKVLKMTPGQVGDPINLAIGMVIDPAGRCVINEFRKSYNIVAYTTTVHSIKLNLELFGIDLEECGKEVVAGL